MHVMIDIVSYINVIIISVHACTYNSRSHDQPCTNNITVHAATYVIKC